MPTKIPNGPASSVAPSDVRFGVPTGWGHRPIPSKPITTLPAGGRHVALTIDDGVDSDVVAGYAKICAETGLRLTFFCNGVYRSWTENAPALRPMVESGQIVLGNHTWNHPALTTLNTGQIAYQLQHNATHLRKLYGVNVQPFLRPPYGYYNQRVLRVVHDLGYPGVVMWYGNLGDDQIISPARVMANAREWVHRGRVVIGHANHPAVTYVYDQLIELIHTRGLQPVTIADAYRRATGG